MKSRRLIVLWAIMLTLVISGCGSNAVNEEVPPGSVRMEDGSMVSQEYLDQQAQIESIERQQEQAEIERQAKIEAAKQKDPAEIEAESIQVIVEDTGLTSEEAKAVNDILLEIGIQKVVRIKEHPLNPDSASLSNMMMYTLHYEPNLFDGFDTVKEKIINIRERKLWRVANSSYTYTNKVFFEADFGGLIDTRTEVEFTQTELETYVAKFKEEVSRQSGRKVEHISTPHFVDNRNQWFFGVYKDVVSVTTFVGMGVQDYNIRVQFDRNTGEIIKFYSLDEGFPFVE